MIDPDMRNAVFRLHQEGMSLREISRRLHVSRNAVRTIVRQQGKLVRKAREDKIQIDPELLERLYRECDGWLQRVHEKLVEEHPIQVGYSTLTRMLRDLALGRCPAVRCDRVPDEPGAEMQHDTSPYQLQLTRELFALSRKVPPQVFVKAAQRALRYPFLQVCVSQLPLSEAGFWAYMTTDGKEFAPVCRAD